MYKIIGVLAFIALCAFAVLWPLGTVYAAFSYLWALLCGAWAWNSKGIGMRLILILQGLVMGFVALVSACIGLAPDAGTLAFGSGSPSIVMTMERYGSGRSEYSFASLALALVPAVVGALLAYWVNKQVSKRDTIPGSPNRPFPAR
jgi:hypothetical protein